MEENIEIESYKILITDNLTQINYSKSSKDWFDIITYILFGSGILGFIYYMTVKSSKPLWTINEFELYNILQYLLVLLLLLAFILFALYNIINSVILLCEPTDKLIIINKQEETITIKLSFNRSLTYTFSEIEDFNLYNDVTVTKRDGISKSSSQCYLYLNTLNNKEKYIHTFRSNKITRSGDISDNDDINSLKRHSQRVSKIIASECGCHCKWNNYIK